ncbi:MAG: hypothetical protein QXI33_02660 [Candidatus Pacearchaeota archaeon]
MKNTPNIEEGWIVYPLEDKKINELVLPKGHISDLRGISKERNEIVGLLYGVPRENSLYLIGYLKLGEGSRKECSFNDIYRDFHNEFMVRAKTIQPELTSVLYHNHPVLSPEEHPQEVIEFLKKEVEAGIFDYLWDYGIQPTINSAIAEQSRYLSESDIKATFGRAHILITDSERNGDDFSHINAYKFDPNFLSGAELFKVTYLSEKPKEIYSWIGGVCSSIKKIDHDLRKEWIKNLNKI